ncbi:MAG: hypothetical protein IKT00_01685 [Prevotella sp.]|nr:hypothetical protein [Prevotella sp.]
MKTNLFFLAALFLATIGVCGCSGEDDDIVNSQPKTFHYLLIKDAEGIDLLNPGNSSGFDINAITLEYGGVNEHPLVSSTNEVKDERLLQSIYFELRFIAEFSSYVLVLGGFDTSVPFKKEFIIHWPDNTSDSFCAENTYSPVKDNNKGGRYDYSFCVNGVKQEDKVVELIKIR